MHAWKAWAQRIVAFATRAHRAVVGRLHRKARVFAPNALIQLRVSKRSQPPWADGPCELLGHGVELLGVLPGKHRGSRR